VIESEATVYDLVGIIVHTGTADAGHYFSFIIHRNPDGTVD
jgi:ubiquitin C-terminal hydrolase